MCVLNACTYVQNINTYICTYTTGGYPTKDNATQSKQKTQICLYYIVVYICQVQFGIYKKFII